MALSEPQKREKARLVAVFRREYDELIGKGVMKVNAIVDIAHRHEVSWGTVQNYLKETEER